MGVKLPFSKDVTSCVKYLLENYPATQVNDNILILFYWIKCDGAEELSKYIDIDHLENHENAKRLYEIEKATKVETITRARRVIQHDKGILYNQSVENKRRVMEDLIRKNAIGRRGIEDFFH